jgi:hypothetical protein
MRTRPTNEATEALQHSNANGYVVLGGQQASRNESSSGGAL